MKLYRVHCYDYGLSTGLQLTIVGKGSTVRAFTNQAEALREYNRKRRELQKAGVRYVISLDVIEAPAMTAELWVQALEDDGLPFRVLENLRADRRVEVAA